MQGSTGKKVRMSTVTCARPCRCKLGAVICTERCLDRVRAVAIACWCAAGVLSESEQVGEAIVAITSSVSVEGRMGGSSRRVDAASIAR
eukprot:6205605-Pleurochrysis_carterae.AAC.3